MLTSKQLASLPIISLENGEELGKIKSLVLDPEKLVISGLILNQKGLLKDPKIIPYDRIEHVGEHAVTVDSAGCVLRASEDPELAKLVKKNSQLAGSKVLTKEGKILGIAAEYYFNPEDAKIVSLELSGSLADKLFKGCASLAVSAVITVGKDAIIVAAGAESLLEHPENPLGETVKNIRDRSSKIWGSTRETTKKLGNNLNKSWENIAKHKKASIDEQDDQAVEDKTCK